MMSKNDKLMVHQNYKMRVVIQDKRTLIGYFKAYDRHMNIILTDCEEVIRKQVLRKMAPVEETKKLGLLILRGQHVVSVTVEGPPEHEEHIYRSRASSNTRPTPQRDYSRSSRDSGRSSRDSGRSSGDNANYSRLAPVRNQLDFSSLGSRYNGDGGRSGGSGGSAGSSSRVSSDYRRSSESSGGCSSARPAPPASRTDDFEYRSPLSRR